MCICHIYIVVVVLVLVDVDVVVLVDVVVVLVEVLVLVEVEVLVLVDVNSKPNQLLPLHLIHRLFTVLKYSSPITGSLGLVVPILILPVMLVICVPMIFKQLSLY